MISGLQFAANDGAARTELHAAGLHNGDGALGPVESDRVTPADENTATAPLWSRHRKRLLIALGATAGVSLVTTGLVLGLRSAQPPTTAVGVVPVTGETPTGAAGGLVSGDKPADPLPATTPQFAPDDNALPPIPDDLPSPAPSPAVPPNPYATESGLDAAAPPSAPNSQSGADGLSPDTLPDGLGDQSQTGADGFGEPSYGPTGSPDAMSPRYRSEPRRYGPDMNRPQSHSNGPLGSLGNRDRDRDGGPRRRPVDDAVPGLGGLGGH